MDDKRIPSETHPNLVHTPLFRLFWVLGLLRDSLAGPCPLVGRLHRQHLGACARSLAAVRPSPCSLLYGTLSASSSYMRAGMLVRSPACLSLSRWLLVCLSTCIPTHPTIVCVPPSHSLPPADRRGGERAGAWGERIL